MSDAVETNTIDSQQLISFPEPTVPARCTSVTHSLDEYRQVPMGTPLPANNGEPQAGGSTVETYHLDSWGEKRKVLRLMDDWKQTVTLLKIAWPLLDHYSGIQVEEYILWNFYVSDNISD